MIDITEDKSVSFLTKAIELHSRTPLIANIIILITFATPLIIATFRYLNKRQAMQLQENTHIRDHEFRMKKRGLK